jgi:hypothetical protein
MKALRPDESVLRDDGVEEVEEPVCTLLVESLLEVPDAGMVRNDEPALIQRNRWKLIRSSISNSTRSSLSP